MSVVTKPKIKPLGARALVKRVDEENQQVGGIYIPDAAKEKPQQAEVIAVGPGARSDDGQLTPLPVKAGDRILLSKYGGTELKYDGEDYLLVREDDILALIEN
ncbi:co-chaperone GroES [Pelagicoccus sp. SDUM812003]|uniref:co-chaperone GroES n=1 Tax=Pelagicoccus sp. SDUM812003 TaxID=3041267 RepID=UPI0028102C3A|nr:co-chaperone GroES [Pelagicoccus sp. SDUM812003]MDQ8202639.1 co-chaperone GroES [Pelagicoccus sp. SDUM812003]